MPEVGVVGDWLSPTVSNPDGLPIIVVFESFKRSDVGLSTPGVGDVEWSEGEIVEADRVSLIRETSVSKDVRWLGDCSAIGSAMPCFPVSDDDVDGRGSSTKTDGRTVSAGCDDVSSLTTSARWGADGEALDGIVAAEVVLGVRNWMLETACLSTVGTFKAGLVACDELKERELTGLGNEVTIADKGVRGFSIAGLTGVSPLMLFCGSERGEGL